ncbi:MAG TPA: hypothetical protein DCX07_12515 [Phycisphaerales bacterium]|nr:hypothetical protein [Phycisphaerales bacterium]
MRTFLTIVALSAAGVWMALACGCTNPDPAKGYSFKSLYPTDIRTVDVPIFHRGKDVYRRELEFRLTEAVKKQIELDTPYKLASKNRADTQLTGTIDEVEQRVLSFNPDTGLAREMEITFVLSLRWTDLRNGKDLRDVRNLKVSGTYVPSAPLSEDFAQGSEDVINRAAVRIVEQMETDW